MKKEPLIHPPRTFGLITRLRHLLRSAEPPISADSFKDDLNERYLPQHPVSRATVSRWVHGNEWTTKNGEIGSESALAVLQWIVDREKNKKSTKSKS